MKTAAPQPHATVHVDMFQQETAERTPPSTCTPTGHGWISSHLFMQSKKPSVSSHFGVVLLPLPVAFALKNEQSCKSVFKRFHILKKCAKYSRSSFRFKVVPLSAGIGASCWLIKDQQCKCWLSLKGSAGSNIPGLF